MSKKNVSSKKKKNLPLEVESPAFIFPPREELCKEAMDITPEMVPHIPADYFPVYFAISDSSNSDVHIVYDNRGEMATTFAQSAISRVKRMGCIPKPKEPPLYITEAKKELKRYELYLSTAKDRDNRDLRAYVLGYNKAVCDADDHTFGAIVKLQLPASPL